MIAALLLLLTQPEEIDRPALQTAWVAEEPPEPGDDCDNPLTVERNHFCAALHFGQAEAALNEQWELTVAAMQERDRAIDRSEDQQPGHFDTLLESQSAWLAFREAQCLNESFVARGDSAQPIMNFFCKIYLTELRTEQLRSMVGEVES